MMYGIIRCELDEYYAYGARWIAGPASLRLFRSKKVRDAVLEDLNDSCECYEAYTPVECLVEDVAAKPRDAHGNFVKVNKTKGI